jgi:hypothetical protein
MNSTIAHKLSRGTWVVIEVGKSLIPVLAQVRNPRVPKSPLLLLRKSTRKPYNFITTETWARDILRLATPEEIESGKVTTGDDDPLDRIIRKVQSGAVARR